MNRYLLVLLLALSLSRISAQEIVTSYLFDDRSLAISSGTSIINDPDAHNGTAMFRPLRVPSDTFWYGPYKYFPAGSYIVQIRLKVGSNLSDNFLFDIDVFSTSKGRLGALSIKPSMFRSSNQWELFSIPVNISEGITDLEVRGVSFTSGIADVYFDYFTISPGEARGFYSDNFTINGKGNVGIGIPDPKNFKLAVKGNIHAQEVNVDMNSWADYVFTPQYELRSLNELETYIKSNQHLPEIPSAIEIASKGLNLGESNKILTKKIEELTLYILELNKTLLNQQKEINQLKTK